MSKKSKKTCDAFPPDRIYIGMKSQFAQETETETIRQAQKGVVAAFESIYRQYQQAAFSLAFRITQDEEIAAEIFQDGMLAVFKQIEHYRFDAPFWSWLRKIFVNQSLMHLRKRQQHRKLVSIYEALPERHQADDSADQIDIATVFNSLSEDKRIVLWLCLVEGYTHKEVANATGHSESWSKTLLSRTRSYLENFHKIKLAQEVVL